MRVGVKDVPTWQEYLAKVIFFSVVLLVGLQLIPLTR